MIARTVNQAVKDALSSQAANHQETVVRILSVEPERSRERYNLGNQLLAAFTGAGWKTDPMDNSAVFIQDSGIIIRVQSEDVSTSNGASDIVAAFNANGLDASIEYDDSMPDWYVFVIIGTN